MFKKAIFLFLSFIAAINTLTAQQVKWYKIEEAAQQAKAQHKKIMIKFYAPWCGWCKEMDKSTFPNKRVASILNESYIPVQFNGEQKTPAMWNGQKYEVVRTASGSYHSLLAQWLTGQITYPTIAILDEDGSGLQIISGYQGAKEFAPLIGYYANSAYMTTDWDTFLKSFQGK